MATSLPPIDLVNGEPGELGGRDPRARLTLATLLVRGGWLNVGHTFDAAPSGTHLARGTARARPGA